MGVPAEVFVDKLGPAKGRLRVDDPVFAIEPIEEVLPLDIVCKAKSAPMEAELALSARGP